MPIQIQPDSSADEIAHSLDDTHNDVQDNIHGQWSTVATSTDIEVLDIPKKDGLDSISVYWRNFETGKGSAVVTCYDSAWSCYFGSMEKETIQQFFNTSDVGYLTNKLGNAQNLKQSKRNNNYLSKIVAAIKSELKRVYV